MNLSSILLLCATAVVLSACGAKSAKDGTALPPPGLSVVEPGKAAVSGAGGGQVRDSGGVATERRKPAGAWQKRGTTQEQQLADNDDCYRYAWAQIDNDIRIDRDIAAARGGLDSEFSRISNLNRQLDGFYYRKERGVRIASCMRGKGYRQD